LGPRRRNEPGYRVDHDAGMSGWARCSETAERAPVSYWVVLETEGTSRPHVAMRGRAVQTGSREATQGTSRSHVAVRESATQAGSREATPGTLRSHVAVRGRAAQRVSRPHMAVWGRATQAGPREAVKRTNQRGREARLWGTQG
jgi:hypothetical protein